MSYVNKLTISILLCLGFAQPTWAKEPFTLTDIDGKTHRLTDYKGRWVLVNVWATWCPPCLKEMPELVKLNAANKKKKLVVLSIAMDSGDVKKVREFAKGLNVNFPIANWNWSQDKKLDERIAAYFGEIEAVPATFLYNPDGKLVATQRGGQITQADIETYIRRNSK